MLKKIRLKHILILLPLLGLGGLVGYKVHQAVKAKSQMQSGAGGAAGQGSGGGGGGRGGGGVGGGGARVQQVQTGAVTTGRVSEKISLTGSLKAKEQVDVNPRIAGRIISIKVDTGQPVARGALIATIEDDEITQQIERSKASIAVVDAQIAQREAELTNAKAELDRKRQLIEAGLLSRIELDTLETRTRVAQSQLELARAQRRQSEAEQRELNIRQGQTRVFAPISGIVSRRHVDTGAMASASTPIVTVMSINPMVIEATTNERDIARIRRGAQVNVTVDSLPGQQFVGRVMRISPQLDPQTRNGQVEIEIPNRNGALKGEMFARIELNLGSQRETSLLPRDALVYRGDQPGVYMLESDIARFRAVETGLTQDDKVEVLNGLKVGDVVITRGSNLIKDGDRVRTMGDRAGGPGGGQGGPGSERGGPRTGGPGGQPQQPSGQPQKQDNASQQRPGRPQQDSGAPRPPRGQ
ncbi:MAG: efflux RND transporter periplasmic adaptor subunit [Blastocatellia bacterium]